MDDPDFEFDPYLKDWLPKRKLIMPQGISNVPIPHFNPHYTDEHYRTARLIWGSEDVKFWNYSDRIVEWYGQKAREAWEQAVNEGFPTQSSAHVQRYLQIIHEDDELELIGIMAGHNLATGYPYQVFGYNYESGK